MTTALPNQFTVTCSADGAPKPGILVLATLQMSRKNPHTAIVGPSSDTGEIVVLKEDLESEASAALNMFPSDYAPLAEFTGAIDLRPMSLDLIESAIKAHTLYSQMSGVSYPTGYKDKLEKAHAALTQLSARRIDAVVKVSPTPTSVRFITESIPFPAAHTSLVG
jgi:hypothetical protein